MEETADEIRRLQGCINDLISVLAIPALWRGQESAQIVSTLLDVLVGMLRLDFAYARLKDPVGGAPIEMVRLAHSRNLTAQPQEIGQVLNGWLGDDPQKWPLLVRNPTGDGDVSIAPSRLGFQGEMGVLVAGSQRADFPTQTERLLLNVAANQAAIGLQEARLLSEQKRVAKKLDQRVAQRTRELAATNEELKKEITERKQAEEKLQRSEAYLTEAQHLSRTGSFGCNISSGEMFWSEETFQIFGYDQATKPGLEAILQRVHPEDKAVVREQIERATEGKDCDLEYRLLLPDGAVKHVHVVAHAAKDEPSRFEFVGAVMDVTGQKEARAKLENAFEEIKRLKD